MKRLLVLIHGTWARRSPWTQPNSNLRKNLECNFNEDSDKSETLAPIWSGGNNQSARIAGSEKIVNDILDSVKNLKNGKPVPTYLMCHSHGTEVGIRAAKKLRSAYSSEINVKGIVAFNSPNILTLRRDFGKSINQIVHFIKYFSYIFASVSISLFIVYLAGHSSNIFQILVSFIVFLIALCVGLLIKLAPERVQEKISDLENVFGAENSDNYLRQEFFHTLSDKDVPPLFVVNSSSDEAWNVLNFTTALAQVPLYITHKYLVRLLLVIGVVFAAWSWSGLGALGLNDLEMADRCNDDWLYCFVPANLDNKPHYPEWIAGIQTWSLGTLDNVLKFTSRITGFGETRALLPGMIEDVHYANAGVRDYFAFFAWLSAALFSILAFAVCLLCMVVLSALGLSLVLTLLVEVIALGTIRPKFISESYKTAEPRRGFSGFLFTRKFVGLIPMGATDIRFADPPKHKGSLSHSEPYNNLEVIRNIIAWIKNPNNPDEELENVKVCNFEKK